MMKSLLATGAAMLALAVAAPAHADLLVDNVEGVTIGADGKLDRFNGLWIDDDGRIRQVLTSGDDRPKKVDFQLDGEGRHVMPGLIDAHLHVMGVGLGAMTLDLSQTTSLKEALEAIRTFAAANPSRPWVIGRGWNQEKWGLGRFPTAAELDGAVPDRPVYLERVDGHAGWANSRAMALAGISKASKSPPGGRVERLPDGNASGIFVDAAEALMRTAIPAPRASDLDIAFSRAQEILLAQGITAAADMGTTMEHWQAFRRAGDDGRLKMRIMSYGAGPDAMYLIGGPGPSRWLYEDRLRFNGVKLYLDGALGSRGAWLKAPYADDPGNIGLPLTDPTRLRNIMSGAAQLNFQVAIHAIGDRANSEVLAAVAELAPSYTGDRRWRIEHAQIVDPSEIALFANHGLIASMQPVHQTSDRLMAEARLGEARLGGAYAWRSIAGTGSRLAFGSDAPVESADPFAGLAVAISRMDAEGQPFGGWRPQETVSREMALAGFTSDAAYAGFADGRFGRLVEGERADFLFVDRDPMLSTPAQLRGAKVLETWVGGEKVYEAD